MAARRKLLAWEIEKKEIEEELEKREREEWYQLAAARWPDSTEYQDFRKFRRNLLLGICAGCVITYIAYYIASFDFDFFGTGEKLLARFVWPLFAIGLIYYITFFFLAVHAARQRRLFADRVKFGIVRDLQDDEQRLAEESLDGKTDFASLWAITQRRIDLYHGIATAQAESSFKVGQRATVAGFVAVIILGIVAAFAKNGAAAIAASVIGVAGAAMSGYVGATFMKAQSEASAQLRQFFLQPVEFSRMLGVERLVETLPDSDRPAAVQQIVKSMMPSVQPVETKTNQAKTS
jgi:hypothetical protein